MKHLFVILGLLLTLSAYPEPQDEADIPVGDAFTDETLSIAFVKSQADTLLLKAKELEQLGINLPKELHPAIHSANHLRNTDAAAVLTQLSAKLNGYHQELDILIESPDKLGIS